MKSEIILLFIFIANCSYSQRYSTEVNEIFKVNDSLNVFAYEGLNLRAEPSPAAKILGKLEYGDQVILKKKTSELDTISYRIGYWILVESDKVEGYVFDGFLSKLKAPTLEQLNREDGILGYLLQEFNSDTNCSITYHVPFVSSYNSDENKRIVISNLSNRVVYRQEWLNDEYVTHQFIFEKYPIRQAELVSLLHIFYSPSEDDEQSKNFNQKVKESKNGNKPVDLNNIKINAGNFGFELIVGRQMSLSFWENYHY